MSRVQSYTSTAAWPRSKPAISSVVGAALKLLNAGRQSDERVEDENPAAGNCRGLSVAAMLTASLPGRGYVPIREYANFRSKSSNDLQRTTGHHPRLNSSGVLDLGISTER